MTAETLSADGWASVDVAEVEYSAGRVRVAGRHQKLRLAGAFHPLSQAATAPRWRLETTLVSPGPSLGGGPTTARAVGSMAVLEEPAVTGDLTGRLFYLVLGTGDGAYRGRGTAISAGDVLRVTVDPGSCLHVDDRARP